MNELHCDVVHCANNKDYYCCRPDIMVGGPDAVASNQTYCANFIDEKDEDPKNVADHETKNPMLDIHCEVSQCIYNEDMACSAENVQIGTTKVNRGQTKTECATFENREEDQ